MRKLVFLLFLLLVPASLFAQSDESWRDRPANDREERDRRPRYRRPVRDDRYDRWTPRRNAFELTPILGYRWGGTIYAEDTGLLLPDVGVASSGAIGGILGIPIGWGGTKLELSVNHQRSELQVTGGLFDPADFISDVDVTYYQAGVSIPFAHSRNATPFISLGLGVASIDPQIRGASTENRFAGSAGIGVKVPINRNLGIRAEARGYLTAISDYDDNDCFRCYDTGSAFAQGETLLGLVISF